MAVIFMIGGKGDQSAVNVSASGTYDDSGTMTWDLAQGDDGALLADTAIAGGDLTEVLSGPNTGKVLITDPPTFGAGTGDAWVDIYIRLTGTANHAEGNYIILASTATTMDIDLAYAGTGGSADETCRARVGGALPIATEASIQDSIDIALAGAFIKIAVDNTGSASINFNDTVNIDIQDGTANSHITIQGVDNGGVELTPGDELPVLTTTLTLANGLVKIGPGTSFYDFRFLDFNGGGIGKAEFCIDNASTLSDFHVIYNCKLHNSDAQCIKWVGDKSALLFSEIYDADRGSNTVPGVAFNGQGSLILGNIIHDNPQDGLFVNDTFTKVSYNLIYNNTVLGINIGNVADQAVVDNNTVYNNGVGIFIDTLADLCFVYNNTSSNSGTYNWRLDNNATHFGYFAHNHSHNGGSGDVDDGFTWADIGEGNNITGDPLFVSVTDGSEDFTPRHGSPLLGAGAPVAFATAAGPLAITNYPHIGALTRKEPKRYPRPAWHGA